MRGVRSRGQGLALVLGVGGAPVEVQWDAPPSCPDAATARTEILARVADRPAAQRLRAHARVHALGDGDWQVDVELRDEDGAATRTLRASSCEEALTATAVVVAIAVDPSLETPPERAQEEPMEGVVPPPPVGDASTEPPRLPEPERLSAPSAAPGEPRAAAVVDRVDAASPDAAAAPRALGLSLAARGGLDLGALPSPAGHVAAAVGLFGRRFVVHAGALHRLRADVDAALPPPRRAGGRFRLTAAQLLAGPRLRWGALELPLAAGLELGAIWAGGTGDVEPTPVRRSWVAALARAGIGWAPREAVALHVGVDAVVPLLRPAFVLGDALPVLTVGSFALRAWLGVVVRFSLRTSRGGGKEP